MSEPMRVTAIRAATDQTMAAFAHDRIAGDHPERDRVLGALARDLAAQFPARDDAGRVLVAASSSLAAAYIQAHQRGRTPDPAFLSALDAIGRLGEHAAHLSTDRSPACGL